MRAWHMVAGADSSCKGKAALNYLGTERGASDRSTTKNTHRPTDFASAADETEAICAAVYEWLPPQGINQKGEYHHDDFAVTAIMMVVPIVVRMKQRIGADRIRTNGIELAPTGKTI